jgi:mono/diheme cytochrome c family protein
MSPRSAISLPRRGKAGPLTAWGLLLVLWVGHSLARAGTAPAPVTPEHAQFFEQTIRPLLVQRCQSCHGPAKQAGGLRLDTAAGLRAGGGRGALLAGARPDESLLLRAVRHQGLQMPPGEKLSPREIADLATWVGLGAPWPATRPEAAGTDIAAARRSYWAFQPLRVPRPPTVKAAGWPRSDIDRHHLRKLEERGLAPAGDAPRRVLLRRVTYGLTGLPPTPEEMDRFLADRSPQAFARVVDRLLADPAYGERWGRHWLDVVRYADAAGDNSDYPIPQNYLYRNWVIAAIQRDLPYDQFITQQLAGDLLPAPPTEADRHQQVIATGYLANARRFGSYEEERYPWHLTFDDAIDNFGRTFLALTINCARCHDHKFDPLTQKDYYALYGIFASTRFPRPGIELDKVQRDFIPLAPREQVEAVEQARRQELAAVEARVKTLETQKSAADRDLKAAPPEQVAAAAARLRQADDRLRAARRERETLEKRPLNLPTAYAVCDLGPGARRKIEDACVQMKGDPAHLGPRVRRGFPEVLGGQTLPEGYQGSGRLELARWLTGPARALTARVMVNRVWQQHFGRGLVPTPSDFGRQGRPPSHPELLDLLAAQFIADGWSLKALHRRILGTRAYQMAGPPAQLSAAEQRAAEVDPENLLLRHFPRRRLDAEAIRDTLLLVGGNLAPAPTGGHPFPEPAAWDFTQHKPFRAIYESNHRSVYLMTQRIQRHPFLALFDGPDPNTGTATRGASTTPLQALFLMNDPLVHRQAEGLATRLLRERSDDSRRLDLAFRLLFSRLPEPEERAACLTHLAAGPAGEAAAWSSLARALFLSSEFLYVD